MACAGAQEVDARRAGARDQARHVEAWVAELEAERRSLADAKRQADAELRVRGVSWEGDVKG